MQADDCANTKLSGTLVVELCRRDRVDPQLAVTEGKAETLLL